MVEARDEKSKVVVHKTYVKKNYETINANPHLFFIFIMWQ